MNTNAWHLQNDGSSYPVKVHMYAMQDDDLASEAEIASFLLHAHVDKDSAKQVLDAWLAFGIENLVGYADTEDNIYDAIEKFLQNLPYRFSYPISISQLISIHDELHNYYDVDSLYEFVDDCRYHIQELWDSMNNSLNQNFCRVRYGGQYNTRPNNGSIWFRISSTGYNWADVIYEFVSRHHRALKIDTVNICRDTESDNGYISNSSDTAFYQAADGHPYYQMPVSEFLTDEHDRRPIFANSSTYFYADAESEEDCSDLLVQVAEMIDNAFDNISHVTVSYHAAFKRCVVYYDADSLRHVAVLDVGRQLCHCSADLLFNAFCNVARG